MKVLYISQNGVTDHIGESQVAPYLFGLAALGHDIHLLSAEKAERAALVPGYAARFAAAGIRWTHIAYHNRPPLVSTAWDLWRMTRIGHAIVRREGTELIHCRSHPAMLVGQAVRRGTAARLLFDFRDFWADGGMDKGRFVAAFRWAKRRESGMIAEADHVVCLTERAADYLAASYPNPSRPRASKYTVIPCCADFDLFRPGDGAPVRAALGIARDALVLLYLGSLGPDYLLDRMMALFAALRVQHPHALFLFVCNNGEPDVRAAAARHDVPEDAIRFTRAAREAVPAYIAAADLSAIFIRPDLAKLGTSPTKLGELFACGVPVIANSGFGDIDAVLDLDRNASIAVSDLSPKAMAAAAERVLAARDRLGRAAIRANAMAFSLDSGVRRYASVYGALTTGAA